MTKVSKDWWKKWTSLRYWKKWDICTQWWTRPMFIQKSVDLSCLIPLITSSILWNLMMTAANIKSRIGKWRLLLLMERLFQAMLRSHRCLREMQIKLNNLLLLPWEENLKMRMMNLLLLNRKLIGTSIIRLSIMVTLLVCHAAQNFLLPLQFKFTTHVSQCHKSRNWCHHQSSINTSILRTQPHLNLWNSAEMTSKKDLRENTLRKSTPLTSELLNPAKEDLLVSSHTPPKRNTIHSFQARDKTTTTREMDHKWDKNTLLREKSRTMPQSMISEKSNPISESPILKKIYIPNRERWPCQDTSRARNLIRLRRTPTPCSTSTIDSRLKKDENQKMT